MYVEAALDKHNPNPESPTAGNSKLVVLSHHEDGVLPVIGILGAPHC